MMPPVHVPSLFSVPVVLFALPIHVAFCLLLIVASLDRTLPVHIAPALLLIVPPFVLVATLPLKLPLLSTVPPLLLRSSWMVPKFVIWPPPLLVMLVAVKDPAPMLLLLPTLML